MANFYALVNITKSTVFILKATDINALNKKIEQDHWSQKQMQPKGKKYEKEDFLKDKEIVKITIESCDQ